MKKLFLSACLSLLLIHVSGQDNSSNEAKNNEFGMHLGMTTSMGLSYRHWFNNIGFQITALPVKTDEVTFISAGVTALYSFYDTKYVMVFGYLGSHYLLRERKNDVYDFYNGISGTEKEHESIYNFGIGPGFAFGRAVRFNLMVGYGFYDVFEKFNMYPTAEIGLYFRF